MECTPCRNRLQMSPTYQPSAFKSCIFLLAVDEYVRTLMSTQMVVDSAGDVGHNTQLSIELSS